MRICDFLVAVVDLLEVSLYLFSACDLLNYVFGFDSQLVYFFDDLGRKSEELLASEGESRHVMSLDVIEV